jgi:malonyl-CoA O-methyltransferase
MNFSKNIMWSPRDYAEAAVVAHDAGAEMLERLEWMTIKPKVILDIGCAGGENSVCLQERYPDAHIVAIDQALPMIQYAKETTLIERCVCGEGEKLPLRDQSVDLIFANFFLPWQDDIKTILKEWLRVLSPNGLLMLTALGLNTLQEWREVLHTNDMPQWVDMHDVGDALLQAGFSDPVLDVNYCQVTYRDVSRLLHDLQASGLWFPSEAMDMNVVTLPSPNEAGIWPLTYEIIYAHTFVPLEKDEFAAAKDGSVSIPLAHLRRRLKGSPE